MDFSRSNLKNNLNLFLEYFSVKTTYIQTLKNKIEKILVLKNSEFRTVNLTLLNKSFESSEESASKLRKKKKTTEAYNVVMYVVDITVRKSNSYLNIFDTTGRLKLSVSAGNLLNTTSRKRKTVRLFLLKSIYRLIAKQKYLKGKPIALHLKNNKAIPFQFLRKLKRKRLLKSITFFYKTPFNGCRNKKVRSV
jgi:ribosomal protein S11